MQSANMQSAHMPCTMDCWPCIREPKTFCCCCRAVQGTCVIVQHSYLQCRVATAGLLHSRCRLRQPWHSLVLGVVPRLASFDPESLPPGSGDRLAEIVAFCQILISELDKYSAPDEVIRAGAITQQLLAYRALANGLFALGNLHR